MSRARADAGAEPPGGANENDKVRTKKKPNGDAEPRVSEWAHRAFDATVFADVFAKTAVVEQMSLITLAARIRDTVADEKKKLPLAKLAVFGSNLTDKGSMRHDANVISITGIEVDYDAGEMTLADAMEKVRLEGVLAVGQTTPSHAANAPRWRIYCPTSKTLPPGRREALVARLNGVLGGVLAPESFALSQAYYLGSVVGNSVQIKVLDGEPIDLHDDLDAKAIGRKASPPKDRASNGKLPNGDILACLGALARDDLAVYTALANAAMLRGGSRSEGAAGLGCALIRAGWTTEEMTEALLACPATREWALEKQAEQGDRQFERIAKLAEIDREPPPRGDAPSPDDGGTAGIQAVALPPTPISEIPPRQFTYGKFLMQGSAAVIGAQDGLGKGLLAVGMALAMVSGRPLLGEEVRKQGPVAIISYEDDLAEWHRRIAAACKHYELDYVAMLRGIRFIQRPGGRLTFGRYDGRSRNVIFPDSAGIIDQLTDFGAVLLVIDPFNHSHDLEDGNSNAAMAKVAAEMSRVAQEAGCAVLVLHHVRKGSSGQVDDLMGATSLRATFRSCRMLARMEEDMARENNIPDPWRHFRYADSKQNFAPPIEEAVWFKLISVELGNATEAYPESDSVGVATSWTPPLAFDGMKGEQLRAVFEALRRDVYSPSPQAKNWAGNALMEFGGRTKGQAKRIASGWIERGVLTETAHKDEVNRHTVKRVILNAAETRKMIEILDGYRPSEKY